MLSAAEKKSDQVYRWLLAYIDENKFSGNQRLPSENALCRKLGVSRETIRVAIDQLVAEGLVYKLKGSGTYFHREKVMTRASSQTTPQSTQFFPPSRNSSPNTRFSRDFVTAYHSGIYNLRASFNTPHPTFHAAKSHLSHLDTWPFAPRSLTFRASKA